MGRRRLIVLAAACSAALVAGCSDDESSDDPPTPGETYALEVERITREVDAGADRVLTALNRFADGNAEAGEVADLLDDLARSTQALERELDELTPPAAAETSASDLVFAAGDIASHQRSAATDVRAVERGISSAGNVGRAQAQILLAYQTGFSALSRAVRTLAAQA